MQLRTHARRARRTTKPTHRGTASRPRLGLDEIQDLVAVTKSLVAASSMQFLADFGD